jgi:nucleoid-associated protein YgaU
MDPETPGDVVPAAAPSTLTLEPVSDKGRTILVESAGLRPSFLDEYRQYTVVEGDTWSALAQRFYKDERFVENLNLANEGMADLVPGKTILVPVFDFKSTEPAVEEPGSLADNTVPAAAFAPAPKDSEPESVVTPKPAGAPVKGGLEYEVRSGDTLSEIALATLGSATRWPELLEANKDRLSKPEALRTGMKLRIPDGGKLPTVAKTAPAKKGEPKKTESAKAPSSSSKKRKVL